VRCRICGTIDLDGKMTISGIGPVCYTCYQKPQKGTFREQMVQKYGTKIKKNQNDRNLGVFL